MEGKNHCSACANVIIVNYNGRHFLGDCLTSLGAQSFRDFEAWVVDNGSTDGSQAMIREQYPEINLIQLSENKGFSIGNNVGIRHARGDFIALLNNDVVLDREWMVNMVAALEADNRQYEERFGHVFLIRASGRSGEEILAELRRRMKNDPAMELAEARRELAQIVEMRLSEMVS